MNGIGRTGDVDDIIFSKVDANGTVSRIPIQF
jgi:hypothetical protein